MAIPLLVDLNNLTEKQLLIMFAENCEQISSARFCTDIYYDHGNKEVTIPYKGTFFGKPFEWSFTSHVGQMNHGSYSHVYFNFKLYNSKRHSEVTKLLKKALTEFIVKDLVIQNPVFQQKMFELKEVA